MSGLVRHEPQRREDWELNQVQIMDFVKQFVKVMGRMPTKAEMSMGTGLSYKTIQRHLKKTTKARVTHTSKLFAANVIEALAVKAMMGDVPAAKLYFQLVMKWDPDKMEPEKDSMEELAKVLLAQQKAMRDMTRGRRDSDRNAGREKAETGTADAAVDRDTRS